MTRGSLIDAVRAACERVAAGGWREMLGRHGLDIHAGDLARELGRGIAVDRTVPGFEDFALEGSRGIEPGAPTRSLLYHAFASARVTGAKTFPTPAEIEAVENYVFGARPPSLEDLWARAGTASLAIVVYASEYRSAADTPHRRHADLCFSRTGISRVGTARPHYLEMSRGWLPFDEADGHRIRVLPCRFSAYVAARVSGDSARHGPMRFHDPDDAERQFWVPLHKLFSGTECIRGMTLSVRLKAEHVNEKLRRAHLFFQNNGHDGGWAEPDISEPPFVLTKGIAEFSQQSDDGEGLLVPVVHSRLVTAASYRGEPLTFNVPETKGTKGPWRLYPRTGAGSTLNLPESPVGARPAPEYVHVRHTRDEDLNLNPDMPEIVRRGGYRARHYVDYTGDGWVEARCSELAVTFPRSVSAYSIVSTPDFFPGVSQSDLMEWTERALPASLAENIWPTVPGHPLALSDQRLAPNLSLTRAGFEPNDDTATAIVTLWGKPGAPTSLPPPERGRAAMLADGAAGVFAPGWDAGIDRAPESGDATTAAVEPGITFLATYGLGSPFPEDTKLCAALASFWPAVAPDITRTFEPSLRYPATTPLLDDVIGFGGRRGWDGIEGPSVDYTRRQVTYTAIAYADYVKSALDNEFDLSAIGRTTREDYIARTLVMAKAYAAVGAITTDEKTRWGVLSFRRSQPGDPEREEACAATGRTLDAERAFRLELIRPLAGSRPDPERFDRRIVEYDLLAVLHADATVVLRRTEDDWTDEALPR